MNTTPLDQYRRLMTQLLIMREAEGGALPIEVEASYVERLDQLWWNLSESEQAAYESELSDTAAPSGPETLDLFDCEVVEGSTSAPRKAA